MAGTSTKPRSIEPREADHSPATAAQVAEVRAMLAELLGRLGGTGQSSTILPCRSSYSVEEVAAMLGRTSFTVRQWCRNGRIEATKRQERRGGAELWSIAAEEVERHRNEGLRKGMS